jgi:hypothetical protein
VIAGDHPFNVNHKLRPVKQNTNPKVEIRIITRESDQDNPEYYEE